MESDIQLATNMLQAIIPVLNDRSIAEQFIRDTFKLARGPQ